MPRKRQLIEPHPGDKRYVRRDRKGQFSEVVDVGRSLSQDRRRKATHTSKPGEGDRGDRAPSSKPPASSSKPSSKRPLP